MHEISVAAGILDRALEAAEEYGADRIDAITVEIGRATHVNPDQLAFCLSAVAEETPAEGLAVHTETIDVVAACDCGWRDTPEDLGVVGGYAPDVRCPNCGARATLLRGRECRLATVDVPDAPEESSTDDAVESGEPTDDRPEQTH
ncbi:MAG: hydrogenase maturation nickel metallochaperone HypA [Halodesulfurarchaeum sp.]